MTEEKPKLKDCPCCGRNHIASWDRNEELNGDLNWRAGCGCANCGLKVEREEESGGKLAAIEAWNRRPDFVRFLFANKEAAERICQAAKELDEAEASDD